MCMRVAMSSFHHNPYLHLPPSPASPPAVSQQLPQPQRAVLSPLSPATAAAPPGPGDSVGRISEESLSVQSLSIPSSTMQVVRGSRHASPTYRSSGGGPTASSAPASPPHSTASPISRTAAPPVSATDPSAPSRRHASAQVSTTALQTPPCTSPLQYGCVPPGHPPLSSPPGGDIPPPPPPPMRPPRDNSASFTMSDVNLSDAAAPPQASAIQNPPLPPTPSSRPPSGVAGAAAAAACTPVRYPISAFSTSRLPATTAGSLVSSQSVWATLLAAPRSQQQQQQQQQRPPPPPPQPEEYSSGSTQSNSWSPSLSAPFAEHLRRGSETRSYGLPTSPLTPPTSAGGLATTLFLDGLPRSIENKHQLRPYVPPAGLVEVRVKRSKGRDVGFAVYDSVDSARDARDWFHNVRLIKEMVQTSSYGVPPHGSGGTVGGALQQHQHPPPTAAAFAATVGGTSPSSASSSFIGLATPVSGPPPQQHSHSSTYEAPLPLAYDDYLRYRDQTPQYALLLRRSISLLAEWARNPETAHQHSVPLASSIPSPSLMYACGGGGEAAFDVVSPPLSHAAPASYMSPPSAEATLRGPVLQYSATLPAAPSAVVYPPPPSQQLQQFQPPQPQPQPQPHPQAAVYYSPPVALDSEYLPSFERPPYPHSVSRSNPQTSQVHEPFSAMQIVQTQPQPLQQIFVELRDTASPPSTHPHPPTLQPGMMSYVDRYDSAMQYTYVQPEPQQQRQPSQPAPMSEPAWQPASAPSFSGSGRALSTRENDLSPQQQQRSAIRTRITSLARPPAIVTQQPQRRHSPPQPQQPCPAGVYPPPAPSITQHQSAAALTSPPLMSFPARVGARRFPPYSTPYDQRRPPSEPSADAYLAEGEEEEYDEEDTAQHAESQHWQGEYAHGAHEGFAGSAAAGPRFALPSTQHQQQLYQQQLQLPSSDEDTPSARSYPYLPPSRQQQQQQQQQTHHSSPSSSRLQRRPSQPPAVGFSTAVPPRRLPTSSWDRRLPSRTLFVKLIHNFDSLAVPVPPPLRRDPRSRVTDAAANAGGEESSLSDAQAPPPPPPFPAVAASTNTVVDSAIILAVSGSAGGAGQPPRSPSQTMSSHSVSSHVSPETPLSGSGRPRGSVMPHHQHHRQHSPSAGPGQTRALMGNRLSSETSHSSPSATTSIPPPPPPPPVQQPQPPQQQHLVVSSDGADGSSGGTVTPQPSVTAEDLFFFQLAQNVLCVEFFSSRFAGVMSFTPFLNPPFFGGGFVRFERDADMQRCLEWMRADEQLRVLFSVQPARSDSLML